MPNYLEKLTPEQYIAATEISGPMMVIAGPGTGKTQVLSSRIAYILEHTDARPENILVLTFTDSGTVAVRRRLQSMIGSAAYYVPIFTFHAFAENIIETYKDYFGGMGGSVISDIDQISLIRSILDNLRLDRLKVTDDPYYYTRDIIRNISTLKREAVSPERLKQLTQDEITDISNDPNNFNKRTQKLKTDTQARLKSLEKTLELVTVYEQYELKLHQSKHHDYDDMIVNVLNQIKNEPELKADLQEKYQYFLVDEYQDTNGAQNQIVNEIASYYDNPDLFVVGDDDQSIYRFQGASLANIMYFHKRYPQAKVVMMTKSHRSTQKVLDVSMSVIKNNTERLTNTIEGINKELISSIESKDSTVQIVDFEHMRFEYYWLVQKIKELTKEKGNYSDIAILLRNNSEVAELSNLFTSYNIPIASDKSSNILDDVDIRSLITLLRCIAEPYDDRLFYTIMCQSWSKITPLDIVKFAQLRYKRKVSYFDLGQDQDLLNKEKIGCIKQVQTKSQSVSLFIESLEASVEENAIVNLTTFLAEQNQKMNSESFIVFFDRLLKEIHFTDDILSKQNRIIKLNRLSTLFDEVKSKTRENPTYSFTDFLSYLEIVDEYNLTISEKVLDFNTNSVKLMTAHKSKGLEFPIVFIPKSVDKYWGNNTNRQNISLPEHIVGDTKPSKDEKNEEERRLFYVALTRAKKQVYISYAQQYENAYGTKNTMPSIFVSEIDSNLVIKESPAIQLDEDYLVREIDQKNVIDEKLNSTEELNPVEHEYIKNLVLELKFSATALNNYLECPRKFYYNNLLHIPQLHNDRQSFGTAMHKSLELFYDETKRLRENNHPQSLPTKVFLTDKFTEIFDKEWVSADSKEKLRQAGIQGLEGYYDQVIVQNSQYQQVLYTELNFDKRNVYLDDIRITGKIDAIIVPSEELLTAATESELVGRVVDYKTGRPKSKNEIEKFTPNTEGQLIPSRHYSQLMFYKILTDKDPSWKVKITHGVLDFIEGRDGKYKQEIFEYNNTDLEAFVLLIKDTYKQIQELKFDKIKKCKTCDKCPFTKICWGG